MNIMVQTTDVYAYSLNGKIYSPNKILANITRALLLNSIQKRELWCFAYQYSTCVSLQNDNIFHDDVTYLLWNTTRTSYKKIKVWGVEVYIIN